MEKSAVCRGNSRGFLHGRGASDDKGQLFTHVKAIESLLKSTGRLPVNVKCLFEGEEEIGRPNLPAFLWRNRRALRADAAPVFPTEVRLIDAGIPEIAFEAGAVGACQGEGGVQIKNPISPPVALVVCS